MSGVTIDEIRLDKQMDAHKTEAEGKHPDDGHDPVHLLIRGPAVPEEADGEDGGKEDHGGEAHFRLVLAVVAGG